jgi:hypothetical protein
LSSRELLTEHVNRFGKYTLNLDRGNPVPDDTLIPRPMPPILKIPENLPARPPVGYGPASGTEQSMIL